MRPVAHTDPIEQAWVEANGTQLGTVADGTYWATAAGVGESADPFVSFRLVQAFFGDACTAQLPGDGCENDYGTRESPSGRYPMPIVGADVTVADGATQRSYRIDGGELIRLLSGASPADGAPPGYTYVPFAYLVRVAGARIVAAGQVWTP